MGLFHHIGTFLLFAAGVLLLVATISAPVINHIALLKVRNENDDILSFGTFGYCLIGAGGSGTDCTKSQVGYSPVDIISQYTSNAYSGSAATTAKGLTRVQVLHAVSCGLSFIAFFTALGSSIVGSLVASLLAAGAFLITLIVTITDFVSWGIVRNQVNDRDDGNRATFEVAIWLVLAALILLFFAAFAVLFACCSSRRRESRARRGHATKHDTAYGTPVRRRRHFWQRRERVARY